MEIMPIRDARRLWLHRNPKAVILKSLLVGVGNCKLNADSDAAKIVPLDVIGTLALLKTRYTKPTEQAACELLQRLLAGICGDENVANMVRCAAV